MTKTNFIVGLSVLCTILLFTNFVDLGGDKSPKNYDEMTAGQLLDVKIGFDDQIQGLKDKRQIVIDKYNIKRGYTTGSAIEQVDKSLGLR